MRAMKKLNIIFFIGCLVTPAAAAPIYLTARTNQISVSLNGGVTWSVFYSQTGAQFRGIAVDESNTVVFVNDLNGGTTTARPIYAVTAGPGVVATNFYDSTGSFNAHPLGWYKGFLYISAGSAGGSASQQMGVTTFTAGQFGQIPPADANVLHWQANDMVFVEWAGIEYMFVNGSDGMAVRRYRRNPDDTNGTFNAHVSLAFNPVGGVFTGHVTGIEVSPRGRIILATTRGLWVSPPYHIISNTIALICAVTNSDTAAENPLTGEMSVNVRDIALDGSTLYAVTDQNIYRFALDDENGTLTFLNANPHGFNHPGVEIAVPRPLPGGQLPRLYLTGRRANVLCSTDGGSNWTRFVRLTGVQTRGLAVDPVSGTVFVSDPTAGSISSRPIWAFDESGALLATNSYDSTGSFNLQPLGFYNGRLYVSAGSAGGSSTQQVGLSAFSNGVFVHVPPISAKVGTWQGNDFAFAAEGTNAFLLLTGSGGTAIRRYLLDPVANDGTVAATVPLTLVPAFGSFPSTWADLAITPGKRLLTVGDNGFWLSDTGVLNSATVTLSRIVTFSSAENPTAGDLGTNARDFVLVGDTVYAITDTHVYRFALDDQAGTLSFVSANPHGFEEGTMIAVRLPSSVSALSPYQLWAQARITNGLTNEFQDADSDGISNLDEWIVDSDPMISNPPFAVTSISTSGGLIRAHFLSSTARVYTLQFTTSLNAHWWSNVAGQVLVPGAGGPTSLSMPAATATALRVVVTIPPP